MMGARYQPTAALYLRFLRNAVRLRREIVEPHLYTAVVRH